MTIKSLFLFICLFIIPSYVLCNDFNHYTNEEIEWIKNNPVIRVGNELNAVPFDFNESGTAKGLSIDYIKLLAQKAGLNINFIYGYTWPELLDLFRQGKIDVLPAFFKNKERKKFALYTKPYFIQQLAVFTMANDEEFNINLINKKIGILKSHGAIPYIKKQLPNINLIELNNQTKLIQWLATKKIDAVIENPFILYYFAQINQINNIHLSDYIEMETEQQSKISMHIGVRLELPILHRILVKASNVVSDEEMLQIKKKWTDISIITTDWSLVAKILGVFFLIVIFLLWNIKTLKFMVSIKTKEITKLNKVLEIKVQERTAELQRVNAELAKQAQTDHLTGILNRRHFFELVKEALKLLKRNNKGSSVLMIDIDHFKSINDSYGHDFGDYVIKKITQGVSSILRDSDIFSRFGGEEFVVFFPDTKVTGALVFAEKARILVENLKVNENVKITISIGVSELLHDDIGDAIKRADSALYVAKENGRNKVEWLMA